MKNLRIIYIAVLLWGAAVIHLAAQTISINKCLVGSSSTFLSGAAINYKISVGVNGGNANNLQITDVLPTNLGVYPGGIVNPPVGSATATVAVSGGTNIGGYIYGGTITWTFTPSIVSGTVFERQLTVKSREGETYSCQQMNAAVATADNILCGSVKKQFASNSMLVNINASNDWRIAKKSIGYVGTNVIRYRITLSRQNGTNLTGFFNLYSPLLTDVAPSGAQLLAVSGPSWLNPVLSGNQITMNKLEVSYFQYPQYIYLDVAYPCNLFPAGSVVENCIKLSGQSPPDCNDGQSAYSEPSGSCVVAAADASVCTRNWTGATYPYPVVPREQVDYPLTGQVCTKDTLPATYTASMGIDKSEMYPIPNHATGCEGRFRVQVCNNGNMPVTNISVSDAWPGSSLTLLSPPTFSPGTAFLGVSYTGTYPAPTTIQFNANSGFHLNPGSCIDIYFNYEITAPTGTAVSNFATVNYTGNLGNPAPNCAGGPSSGSGTASDSVNFTVEPPAPRPTICKSVVGNPNLLPGQHVQFRVCIANYGGGGLTGTLKDILPPQLINPQVIGYYYSGNSSGYCLSLSAGSFQTTPPNNPDNGNPVIGSYTITSGTITWNNVNLQQQCEINKWAVLCILLEATVADYTPSGPYQNKAELTPTGGSAIPAVANITVAQLSTIQTWKYVKGDLDADYNTSGNATPGSPVKFRIFIRNTGTVPVNNVVVADQLPALVAAVKNSNIQAFVCTNASVSGSLPYTCSSPSGQAFTPTYFATAPPVGCLTKNDCTTITCPAGVAAPQRIVRINFGPGLVLQPGDLLWVDITTTLSPAAPANSTLCNTSSARACNKNDQAATQISEGNVCLTVKPFVPSCCPKNSEIFVQHNTGSYQLSNQVTHTLLQTNFDLIAAPYAIQEVRVTITDKNIAYQPDAACVQCYTRYKYLGTFTQPQASLSSLLLNGTGIPYTVINKEIVYKVGAPAMFSSAQTLAVNIMLPDLQNIPCCEAKGEVCLKFVFKDVNCNYCERVICLPVSYNGQ